MDENQFPTRRNFVRMTGLLTLAGFAGCAGGSSSNGGGEDDEHSGDDGHEDGHEAPHEVTVDMTDDLTYEPERVTVAAGGAVTWENVGDVGHTVTAYEDEIPDGAEYFASGGFDAEDPARNEYPSKGDIPGGATYEHTFETAGEYQYFCVPHESAEMVGWIEVV